MLLDQFISQAPKLGKKRTNFLQVIRERRHGHESGDLDAGQGEDGLELLANLLGRKPGLGLIARDIDLQEEAWTQLEIFRNAIHPLGKRKRIDAVNHRTEGQNFSHLVLLQGANEMPFEMVGKSGYFLKNLLHLVFSENDLPGCRRFRDPIRGPGLADRDKSDFCRIATGGERGRSHGLVHFGQVLCNAHRLLFRRLRSPSLSKRTIFHSSRISPPTWV